MKRKKSFQLRYVGIKKPERTCSKGSQFTEMILPCEIKQIDIPDVGRNHILYFLFSFQSVKIISVQEIYSDSLFEIRFFSVEDQIRDGLQTQK